MADTHLAARVSERELQAYAGAEASRLSVLWHHCPDSRRCEGPAGFPDLLMVGPGGLVLAELKAPGAGTSAGQDLWGWSIHNHLKLCVPVLASRDQVDTVLQSVARCQACGRLPAMPSAPCRACLDYRPGQR